MRWESSARPNPGMTPSMTHQPPNTSKDVQQLDHSTAIALICTASVGWERSVYLVLRLVGQIVHLDPKTTEGLMTPAEQHRHFNTRRFEISRRSWRIWSWQIRLNFDRSIGFPANQGVGSTKAK